MSTRITLPVLSMMTHDQGMKDCMVTTSTAIHTIEYDGTWYAALVLNQRECPIGAVAILDRSEIEAQIALLQNAIDDADRLNAGKAPIHSTHSLVRN